MGPGSEIYYTERLRGWMIDVLAKHEIKKFVDAPCGDFNWMKLVVPQLDIEYYGFDIVDSVIEKNNEHYKSDKVHFGVTNICDDKLPHCDLLMIRDCLFHLSYNDINKFLENIADVDYKYLFTTTYLVEKNFINSDIRTGDYRIIDLFREPFNFNDKSIVERVDDFPLDDPLLREMNSGC